MGAWKRFRGRSGPQPQFGKRAYKAMQRAHHLMESGDHANAAVLLEEVALNAHDRGVERPAAFLFLQAARANLLSGQVEHGADLLRRSLGILAPEEHWDTLRPVGQRLLNDLRALGLPDLANEVETWLANTLPSKTSAPLDSSPPRLSEFERGAGLPRNCPSCGAVVRPEEVAQNGETTRCAYCDNVLTAGRPG